MKRYSYQQDKDFDVDDEEKGSDGVNGGATVMITGSWNNQIIKIALVVETMIVMKRRGGMVL